jgi:hypothetical protein
VLPSHNTYSESVSRQADTNRSGIRFPTAEFPDAFLGPYHTDNVGVVEHMVIIAASVFFRLNQDLTALFR